MPRGNAKRRELRVGDIVDVALTIPVEVRECIQCGWLFVPPVVKSGPAYRISQSKTCSAKCKRHFQSEQNAFTWGDKKLNDPEAYAKHVKQLRDGLERYRQSQASPRQAADSRQSCQSSR